MESEPKNQSRNFRSEKFVCSDFLAEWKTALSFYFTGFCYFLSINYLI